MANNIFSNETIYYANDTVNVNILIVRRFTPKDVKYSGIHIHIRHMLNTDSGLCVMNYIIIIVNRKAKQKYHGLKSHRHLSRSTD